LGTPKWAANVGVKSHLGSDMGDREAEGKTFQPPPFMNMILEDLNFITEHHFYCVRIYTKCLPLQNIYKMSSITEEYIQI
jgi:hypothetical protein